MINVKQNCEKCGAFDYLSTVDGEKVCAKCAADAFWNRMPANLKQNFKRPGQ